VLESEKTFEVYFGGLNSTPEEAGARGCAPTRHSRHLERGLCSRTEEGGDEIEVGGFCDGEADLELHNVWRDGILIFAKRAEQDLIERLAARSDLAIDLDR
jgi:hypothetical protein